MVSDDKMLDSFLQASNSFARLGMGHILLLSYTEAMCTAINSIVPDVGCAWSSFEEPPDLQDVYYLWSLRYRTLARSLRLGYNVLLVDSDTAVFDDPYKYFKQPPFQDIVVLNQEESPVEANGGNLYVQNAAPDGPAVFMFAEIVSRPLRWADDEWETASKHSLNKQCLYMDQDAYADVLPDMASGYMLFPKALWCVDEASRAQADWQELNDNIGKTIRWSERYSQTEVAVPKDWQEVVGGPETTLKTLQLRMPNCRGWPEELGGEWYPRERGKYSTDFLQQLQQDRPETPLWLDPEDAANAAAADKVPTEKFALMPRWVGCSWTWRGKAGYWDPNITGNVAQQVIGHTHAIPNGNRAMAKRVIPQSLGIYDWELALKANKEKPYFACTGFDCTHLRVLAFTPTVEQLLADSASWLEFSLLLQGLAQLGQLLGRTVAWPSLPCKTSWINPAFVIKRTHEVPLKLGELWLPWTSSTAELIRQMDFLPWEWRQFQDENHDNAGQPQ
ncbi:MAG: hypothetical protein FRX49_01835 [Trebouxia sp. A1-2]|nr:MAG: hypothetical protein FRX49_01835 [Trebouxia sp. A1-2]